MIMKKLFCAVLIIFVLTACNTTLPYDTTNKDEGVSVESTADSASNDQEEILDIDSAFDAYLKGEISATDGSEKRYVYQHTCISDGKEGIDTYALYDVTGDGVPELHLHFMGYEILMCQNGKLVTIYDSRTNLQHGPITLLENGAMFEEHTTFDTMYTYTTFNADGTTNEIQFELLEYPEEEKERNTYYFEGRKVTKQEFDELTKEIFAAARKKAELNWIEWNAE